MSAKHTPIRPDIATFLQCVGAARAARTLRSYAKAIRSGTSVYGWTLGTAEAEARRLERSVRIAADLAIKEVEHYGPWIAKAEGSAS